MTPHILSILRTAIAKKGQTGWRLFLLTWWLFLLSNTAQSAGVPQVNAELKRTSMLLGDTISLYFTAQIPLSYQLQWPRIVDTLANFEVLSKMPLDSSDADNMRNYRQKLLLTVFEEGEQRLPPIRFTCADRNSSLRMVMETSAQYVQVDSVKVDMQQAEKPIAPPRNLPFIWTEALPYIAAGLALVIALFGAWFWWRKRQQQPTTQVQNVAPPRPAHEIALERLQKLEKAGYWQKGQTKQYYSELSEITRWYLEERFQFSALELTTDEIIYLLEHGVSDLPDGHLWKQNSAELRKTLQHLLHTADMVKFAKATTSIETNIDAAKKAELIIRKTKANALEFTER